MEVKILKKDKNSIKFEIIGDKHTLTNLLSKELWNDKDIAVSGYRVDNPLLSNVIMIVKTEKGDPIKTMEDAVKRIKKLNKDFLAKFKTATK